ncbi:MAG: patatin [Hyphomicrobiales bacterium]|nr:patatin [Hyphomicrobiales bacterium]
MTAETRLATDSAGRKEILALDGGGVRGVIAIAFLERIEQLYRERAGASAALSDRFDMIGGTSTGAIIATALSLGRSTADLRDFYFDLAPQVFRRGRVRVAFIQTLFDAESLHREIRKVVGARRLDTPDLKTALAIVAKRLDTGGAWLITNNPNARFWEDPADAGYIGNRNYLLADLVRASTAAPYYFAPQQIRIAEGAPPGLFIDGGITPHNNPALALLQLATIPAYGYNWPVGEHRLRIVSLGTGARRDTMSAAAARRMPAAGLAIQALASMVADSSNQVLTVMQMLGRSDTPWEVNSEIGDLHDVLLPDAPLFTFQRYDVRLDRAWLRDELGITVRSAQLAELGRLDAAAVLPLAYEIGQAAAEKQIRPEHLGLEPGP